MSQTTKTVIEMTKTDVLVFCLVILILSSVHEELIYKLSYYYNYLAKGIASDWYHIKQYYGGFSMSSFFLWGGFVFCLLWHLLYLKVFVDNLLDLDHGLDETAMQMITLIVIVSGIGLCFFGINAFG